ncbi:MAG: aldehyde dehydrogenase family protein, partial [Bacteroidota bacterium]|nr:aldehyde dehydrogenase family protein [Bacteroidota bacterium]
MSKTATAFGIEEALKELGLNEINNGTSTGADWFSNGDIIESYSPVDGQLIGKVKATTKEDYEKVISTAQEGFKKWRTLPAPQRGEVVRQFNDELRRLKEPLGKLVSYEMGKSYQEGLGEVQEMIDICDFAVGL